MENCDDKLTLAYCPFCEKINKYPEHIEAGNLN